MMFVVLLLSILPIGARKFNVYLEASVTLLIVDAAATLTYPNSTETVPPFCLQVFWVLPQINKSESATRQHLASATERYEALVEQLGGDR